MNDLPTAAAGDATGADGHDHALAGDGGRHGGCDQFVVRAEDLDHSIAGGRDGERLADALTLQRHRELAERIAIALLDLLADRLLHRAQQQRGTDAEHERHEQDDRHRHPEPNGRTGTGRAHRQADGDGHGRTTGCRARRSMRQPSPTIR